MLVFLHLGRYDNLVAANFDLTLFLVFLRVKTVSAL